MSGETVVREICYHGNEAGNNEGFVLQFTFDRDTIRIISMVTNSSETMIDYERLESELDDAIRADALYQLQNDAKIRAMEQRVPTYDQFRDMVNAAHLKPLDRADMHPKVGVQWNSVFAGFRSRASAIASIVSQHSADNDAKSFADTGVVPKNADEFLQAWKKIRAFDARFEYLWRIRSTSLKDVFRPEIPMALLGEILNVCLKNLQANDHHMKTVIDILSDLSTCQRFELSINFMTKEEKDVCTELFQRLLAKDRIEEGLNQVELVILTKRYEIVLHE